MICISTLIFITILTVLTKNEESCMSCDPSTNGDTKTSFLDPSNTGNLVTIEISPEEVKECQKYLESHLLLDYSLHTSDTTFIKVEQRMKIPHAEKQLLDVHYYHLKQQTEKPKGVVFYFHGYSAYGGTVLFNRPIALELAQDGFDVVIFDQEEHGYTCPEEFRNPSPRCLISDFRRMLENAFHFTDKFLEMESSRLEKVPVFLWGSSMGGETVLGLNLYLIDHQKHGLLKRIKGMVLEAPALTMIAEPSYFVQQYILRPLSYLFPKFAYPGVVVVCSQFEKMHQSFQDDVMTQNGDILFSTARELLFMSRFIKKKQNMRRLSIPYLLLHGDKDNMCRIEGSYYMWNETVRIRNDDKTFVVFKDTLHDIGSDISGKKVFKMGREWIKNRL